MITEGEVRVKMDAPLRQSISPTYDHRETGDRFTVETRINRRQVGEQRITDPFIRTTVRIGWRDLLRSLWRGVAVVEICVRGDSEIETDVMELDANYLAPHSTRMRDFKQQIETSLGRLAMTPADEELN